MSDANIVMVKALRPFEGEEGFKSPESEPFEVSRQRFADLKANGLVAEATGEAEQKPAAKASNKAARQHETK